MKCNNRELEVKTVIRKAVIILQNQWDMRGGNHAGGSSSRSRDPDITLFELVSDVLDWIYSHLLREVWKVLWASRYWAIFWGCRFSSWLLGVLKTDIIKDGSETEQSVSGCPGQILLRVRCEQRERASCSVALLRGRFHGSDRWTGPVFITQTRVIHPERDHTHQRPERRWHWRAENTDDRLFTCTPDASHAGR